MDHEIGTEGCVGELRLVTKMMCDQCHRKVSEIEEIASLLFSSYEFFIPCCRDCRVELLDEIDEVEEKVGLANIEVLIKACEAAAPVVALPSSALIGLLREMGRLRELERVVDKARG